LRCW